MAETSLKWRVGEPSPGQFSFDLADAELAWAQGLGLPVKGHTLLWGNAPPFSTGSGIPNWLLDQFPNPSLSPAEQDELRGLIRRRVEAAVGRYRGRIDIWDVTNETLNPSPSGSSTGSGPGIVNDIFRLDARRRPRRAAGVQRMDHRGVHRPRRVRTRPPCATASWRCSPPACRSTPSGSRRTSSPGVVYAGGTADLSQRTRIDDYAVALDTLAETGLPIHVTETNVIAPDEPERARRSSRR